MREHQFPKGYWTRQRVCEDAKLYFSKSEWIRVSGSAYQAGFKNGWLEEACGHMIAILKSWDKASVLSSAQKYPSRSAWKVAESGAYKAAVRNDWLKEATLHMKVKKRSWTIAELQESAQGFKTRSDWKMTNQSAYRAAQRSGELDKICAHMDFAYRPDGWWKNKQNVIDSSSRFYTLQMWNEAETSAVQAARKNGWIDEATAHMSELPMPIGPATIHEFLLTHNIPYKAEQRFKNSPEVSRMPFDFYLPHLQMVIEYHGRQHKFGWGANKDSLEQIQKNDRIKKAWAIESGLKFIEICAWTDTTKDKILAHLELALGSDQSEPRALTKEEIRKISTGYVWDEESLMQDASKYRSRADWMNQSPSAYRFAIRHRLSKAATQHMEYVTEHGKWTREAVIESARPHASLSAWRKAEPSAYIISYRLKCFDEATQHMSRAKRPNGYWTDERLLQEAKKFDSTAAWRKESASSYTIARKRGLSHYLIK